VRFSRSIAPWLACLTIGTGTAPGAEAGPLRPEATVGPGPYFVGQAIDLRVGVPGSDPPAISPPKVEGAAVIPAGGGRFRVIARRSGVLLIPPMTAQAGGRSGRTAPIRLTVRDLPAAGRPANFLGGVGSFQVQAEAQPATVRVGEPIEFRVRLTGPGARGSAGRPMLAGKALDDLRIRVEPLATEAADEPPARVIRYRLRAGRAGAGTLPPVAVAYFDPKTGRYFTRAAAAVAIRVEEAPVFDPAAVRYGPAREGAAGSRLDGVAVGLGGLAIGLILAGVLIARNRRRRPGLGPRRLAARLAGEVGGAGTKIATARRITEGLADYLAEATGGPVGALTPEEARRGIAGVSGDEALADAAARLVAACDRVRYAGAGESPVADAAALFGALAGLEPREAPRAAER